MTRRTAAGTAGGTRASGGGAAWTGRSATAAAGTGRRRRARPRPAAHRSPRACATGRAGGRLAGRPPARASSMAGPSRPRHARSATASAASARRAPSRGTTTETGTASGSAVARGTGEATVRPGPSARSGPVATGGNRQLTPSGGLFPAHHRLPSRAVEDALALPPRVGHALTHRIHRQLAPSSVRRRFSAAGGAAGF